MGEGLISFNIDNSASFLGENKYDEAFRGVYFMRIREKTLRQILYSYESSLSLNLKISIFIRELKNSKEKIEGLWTG